MPRTHTLRVHHVDFDAIRSGDNSMLISLDREFRTGEMVELCRMIGLSKWGIDPDAPLLVRRIAQIKRGGSGGLLSGYVVLNLAEVEAVEKAA